MPFENIILEIEEPVAVLSINRPKALNALSADVLNEIESALDQLEANENVRVLIVTGAGEKAFVAGADIGELKACDAQAAIKLAVRGQKLFCRFEASRLITIAAVNGFALGGGCELAMAMDIRLASDNALLGQPEVNLGIIPGYGGTQRLASLVGKGKALQMITSGDPLKAEDAKAVGLVQEVYPKEELIDQAKKMAGKIASKGPLAIAAAKRCVYTGLSVDTESGMSYEASQFGVVFATEDKDEGLGAFLEKRKPEFKAK
jgi:enoyl-CoA hydratase